MWDSPICLNGARRTSRSRSIRCHPCCFLSHAHAWILRRSQGVCRLGENPPQFCLCQLYLRVDANQDSDWVREHLSEPNGELTRAFEALSRSDFIRLSARSDFPHPDSLLATRLTSRRMPRSAGRGPLIVAWGALKLTSFTVLIRRARFCPDKCSSF